LLAEVVPGEMKVIAKQGVPDCHRFASIQEAWQRMGLGAGESDSPLLLLPEPKLESVQQGIEAEFETPVRWGVDQFIR